MLMIVAAQSMLNGTSVFRSNIVLNRTFWELANMGGGCCFYAELAALDPVFSPSLPTLQYQTISFV